MHQRDGSFDQFPRLFPDKIAEPTASGNEADSSDILVQDALRAVPVTAPPTVVTVPCARDGVSAAAVSEPEPETHRLIAGCRASSGQARKR